MDDAQTAGPADSSAGDREGSGDLPLPELSPEEQALIRHLRRSASLWELSQEYRVSERELRARIQGIFRKLTPVHRRQAVIRALEQQFNENNPLNQPSRDKSW